MAGKKDVVISIFVILFIVYLASLLSGGFIDIVYFTALILAWAPGAYMIWFIVNIIGVLLTIYLILKSNFNLLIIYTVIMIILLPLTLIILGLISFLFFYYFYDEHNDEYKVKYRKILISYMLLIFLGLIIVTIGALYYQVASSELVEASTINNIINVHGENRLIPLYTAHVYGVDRVQIPTHTIYRAESYIYYENDTPIYNWLIEPEGFWNSLKHRARGLLLVRGDKYPANITEIWREPYWSIHKLYWKWIYFDSLDRQLKMRALGCRILMNEAVEVYRDGEIIIIVPAIGFHKNFFGSVTIPCKYFIVHEDGHIETLSYEQAVKDSRLRGVPLIPEGVARDWVTKYSYHKGFWNVYLRHDKYVIRNFGGNPQPYLVVDDNGTLYWVFMVEPAGKTYSIKHIIYIKAREYKGKPYLELYTPRKMMIGVSALRSYIKQAHPRYDWSQFNIVEPMPIIKNGKLYWKVAIVSYDFRVLINIDLVDAQKATIKTLQIKERATPEDIVNLLNQNTTQTHQENQTQAKTDILQQIKQLREEINKTITHLQELEKQITNQTKTR